VNVALAQRYSRFSTHLLTDEEITCAAMATAVCASGAPGWQLYIAQVSCCSEVLPPVATWALAVTTAWARESVLGPTAQRRRQRIASFDLAWALSAIHAGVALSLWGVASFEQPAELVSAPTWRRVRDFARDLTAAALEEFEHALAWAWGIARDRQLDERWAAIWRLRISQNAPRAMKGATAWGAPAGTALHLMPGAPAADPATGDGLGSDPGGTTTAPVP
jgi:hypothetical protein